MSHNTNTWKEDRCPRCLSSNIKHGELEVWKPLSRKSGMRKGVCINCGLEFNRVYNLEYGVNIDTEEREVLETYDYTSWSGNCPDIRKPIYKKPSPVSIKPFPLSASTRITLEEFENAKYDVAARVNERREEDNKFIRGIYEKAAQLGIFWVPFKRRISWWKFWKTESWVKIVDPRREYKDGTFYEHDCKEEELFYYLKAFVEM